jgi:hypothetical protein
MIRFGRIRINLASSELRDGIIVPTRTSLELVDDHGAVVGTVELQDLLTVLCDRVAAVGGRLAAVEALAKVETGDTPEVARLKKQVSDAAKGREKGSARSAEARRKVRERWLAELGPHIRTMRDNEPDLTKNEIITRLIATKPWPFKCKPLSRSTLEKANSLWE